MYLLVSMEPDGNSYNLYDTQEEAFAVAEEYLGALAIEGEVRQLGTVDEYGYMTDLIHLGDWGMKVLTNEDLYGSPVQPH